MPAIARAWNAATERSAALRFADINLRGAGQVIFQDNPLTGALFIAAIAWVPSPRTGLPSPPARWPRCSWRP